MSEQGREFDFPINTAAADSTFNYEKGRLEHSAYSKLTSAEREARMEKVALLLNSSQFVKKQILRWIVGDAVAEKLELGGADKVWRSVD